MIRVEIDINDDGGPSYNWPAGPQPVCPACDEPWEVRGRPSQRNASISYEAPGNLILECDCGYRVEVKQ